MFTLYFSYWMKCPPHFSSRHTRKTRLTATPQRTGLFRDDQPRRSLSRAEFELPLLLCRSPCRRPRWGSGGAPGPREPRFRDPLGKTGVLAHTVFSRSPPRKEGPGERPYILPASLQAFSDGASLATRSGPWIRSPRLWSTLARPPGKGRGPEGGSAEGRHLRRRVHFPFGRCKGLEPPRVPEAKSGRDRTSGLPVVCRRGRGPLIRTWRRREANRKRPWNHFRRDKERARRERSKKKNLRADRGGCLLFFFFQCIQTFLYIQSPCKGRDHVFLSSRRLLPSLSVSPRGSRARTGVGVWGARGRPLPPLIGQGKVGTG